MIARPNGTLTGNAKEIDEILQDAWGKIFRLYGEAPEPDPAAFEQRFGSYFPKSDAPMACAPLSVDRLRAALAETPRTLRRILGHTGTLRHILGQSGML